MVLPERALDKSVLRSPPIIQFTTLCLMKKLDNVASISLYSCKLHCVELSHGKYTLKTYMKPTFVLNLTQHIRSLSIVINSVLVDNDFLFFQNNSISKKFLTKLSFENYTGLLFL